MTDKLLLDGKFYSVDDLDTLPDELKLHNLSTKTVDNITAFFTKDSVFSNHHPCKFTDGDNQFSSVEQYFMFHKAQHFGDQSTAQKIMESNDPKEAKELGKKVKNFERNAWRATCETYMYKGVKAKFEQNTLLKKHLKDTTGQTLVEANPNDRYWGAGLSLQSRDLWNTTNWKGQNRLGKLLCQLRDEL